MGAAKLRRHALRGEQSVSARSRALNHLAHHFEALRDGSCGELPKDGQPIYNGWESWDHAAHMARRTADEETWASRIRRLFTRY